MASKPVQRDQIENIQASWVGVDGFTANGGSDDISTALSTALATAGESHVTKAAAAVPVQPSASKGVGVITTGATNRVEIFDGTTGDKIEEGGREVYGELTEAGGVYTVTYFYDDATGAQTAYSFAANTTIDLEIPYRFPFHLLPIDHAIAYSSRRVQTDVPGTSGGAIAKHEQLTVTALNTLSALSVAPNDPLLLVLNVNGVDYYPLKGVEAPVTSTGTTVTWRQDKAGFDLQTTYDVVARFYIDS